LATDFLLEREEDRPGFPWTPFRLDLPARRCAVPDYRCQFLAAEHIAGGSGRKPPSGH